MLIVINMRKICFAFLCCISTDLGNASQNKFSVLKRIKCDSFEVIRIDSITKYRQILESELYNIQYSIRGLEELNDFRTFLQNILSRMNNLGLSYNFDSLKNAVLDNNKNNELSIENTTNINSIKNAITNGKNAAFQINIRNAFESFLTNTNKCDVALIYKGLKNIINKALNSICDSQTLNIIKTKYFGFFLTNINEYYTFCDDCSQHKFSAKERFAHELFKHVVSLDYIDSNMKLRRDNCACATVTFLDGNNNAIRECLLVDTIFYDKYNNNIQKIIDMIHSINNNLKKISITKNFEVYTYSKRDIIKNTIINSEDKDNELIRVLYVYHSIENRTQILDDEFQILYYLFFNICKITNGLKQKNINNMKIKIFTFMDMCPACFTAWHMLYDKLKNAYHNNLIINVADNLNLNVDVYSIKPYCDTNHSFFKGQENDNTNKYKENQKDNESKSFTNWKNVSQNYTRRVIKYENNSKKYIIQHIDYESVDNLCYLSGKLNNEKFKTSANNYIDDIIVDFFTCKENMKMENIQKYYNNSIKLQFDNKKKNKVQYHKYKNEDLEKGNIDEQY